MTAGASQRLYILSFDHRGSFKKGLMGITGEPTGRSAGGSRSSRR